jgi:hypothetical protein
MIGVKPEGCKKAVIWWSKEKERRTFLREDGGMIGMHVLYE